MKVHLSDAVSRRTTPGTRRAWSTGQQWVAQLRSLVRSTGRRAKGYVDLEAHMVACDREFIRSRSALELYAIAQALSDPKLRSQSLVVPPRGQRAGSPYELIVNEVHNALQHKRAIEKRNRERFEREVRADARRVQLTLFPLWAEQPIAVAS